MLPGKPPPVMWRERADLAALDERLERGEVARGGERAAPRPRWSRARARGCRRGGPAPRTGPCGRGSSRSCGGPAEGSPMRTSPSRTLEREGLLPIDHSHDEAGEIVVVGGVGPRHLRRLAADEGAAELRAAAREPGHDLLDPHRVHLAEGDVVEEEERASRPARGCRSRSGPRGRSPRCRAPRRRGRPGSSSPPRRWRPRAPAPRSGRSRGGTSPPKDPISERTAGLKVPRARALMRPLASSAASMSTPASR